MNEKQRQLVETHLDVVKWAIYKYIKTNNCIAGLSYDDVYQEGCAALCKAAATYDGSVKFVTYAQVVVKNALISYCRSVACNLKTSVVPMGDLEPILDSVSSGSGGSAEDIVMEADMLKLLESLKAEYSGTARLGIEALELKIKGYSGADISRMYGVKPNLVGAWISRAASKLRQNERFLAAFGDSVPGPTQP